MALLSTPYSTNKGLRSQRPPVTLLPVGAIQELSEINSDDELHTSYNLSSTDASAEQHVLFLPPRKNIVVPPQKYSTRQTS